MKAPDVAGDYTERDVQAAYSVLIELGQVLGAFRQVRAWLVALGINEA